MSATETGSHITGVRTIAVPVADQDRALEFYTDVLGFETRLDMRYGEGERWVEVAPPGSTTTIALTRARESDPAGIDTHVRLTTADAAADYAALKARGVSVADEILRYPVPMFFFSDIDGNRLIAVEPPARAGRDQG